MARDDASNGFGLRLGNGLSVEQGLNGVLQVVPSGLASALAKIRVLIIDSPAVANVSLLINDDCFRRDAGTGGGHELMFAVDHDGAG